MGPERELSIDLEWRLVCTVERVLVERPELRPILERVVAAELDGRYDDER